MAAREGNTANTGFFQAGEKFQTTPQIELAGLIVAANGAREVAIGYPGARDLRTGQAEVALG
jgi:hypothetical protein